jgi:hypothetical protein
MLLKAIPRRSRVFLPRITENPKFQAPIPLYPEQDTVDGEADKVKVNLRRNPSQSTSAVYEKNIHAMDRSYDRGVLLFQGHVERIYETGPVK